MKINPQGNPNQIRQGDVFIEACAAVPAGAVRVPRTDRGYVLAYGEVTGHAHAIAEDVELYEKNGILYLKVPDTGATVTHEEHAAHVLSPGIHRVTRKREWTDDDERIVVD